MDIEDLKALGLNAATDQLPEVEEQTPEYVDELLNFAKFTIIGKQLKNDWKTEVERTEENRELRKLECDPEELRESKQIQDDETYIVDRVIDTNIKREQPAFLNFLTAARNVVTFTRKDNMSANERLEEKFTRGAKYVGWEMPFIKETDGAATHGWDAVEVIFDDTKPLKFAIEHIGHDKLFFAYGSQDINAEDVIMREYDVTCSQLRSYIRKSAFDEVVVNGILADKNSPAKRFQNIKIYKVYFKIEGIVYIAWASFDGAAKDWLRKPEKLRLGISNLETIAIPVPVNAPPAVAATLAASPTTQRWVEQDITNYPVFILVYNQDEQKEITAHLGRAHIDLPAQEASTTLWTAQVNQALRASYLMFSYDSSDGSGGALKQTQMKLGSGIVVGEPLRQFKIDEPDGGILKVLQALKMQNTEAAGQTLQSALSKGPSARTTGIEIETAKEQQGQLSMINLLLFSMHIRDVYTYGWQITQSQIMQGNLWQGIFTSEEIATDYELRAGGDTDVIQRAEKLNRMMQFWPVVAQTPIASSFMISMLQLAFPTECQPWVESLKQQDPRMVAAMLADMLRATLTPEELAGLDMQQRQIMSQAMQAAEAFKVQLQLPSAPKNDNNPTGSSQDNAVETQGAQ